MAKKQAIELAVKFTVKNAIVAFTDAEGNASLRIGDLPISAHNLDITTDDFEEKSSKNGHTYWATPNKWNVTLEVTANGRVTAVDGKETDEPSATGKKLVFRKASKGAESPDEDA